MPTSIPSKIFQKMFDWVLTIFIHPDGNVGLDRNPKRKAPQSGAFLFVMPYQNRFPVFRKKNHLILRRITIGAYAMLPFRRATAYNSLIA